VSLQKLERERLSSTVQKAIKDFIVESELKAGDSIPTEKQLEEELGISRAAIRESLKSLEALGIIGVKPGVGRFLRSFDFGTILDNLSFSIELNPKDFANVLELRKVLESTFLRRSTGLYTDEDIAALHALLDNISSRVQEGECEFELIQLHTEFHLLLYRHLDNQLLTDLIKIFATIQRTVWVTFNHVTGDREEFIRVHRNIVNAIEQRDPDLAEQRMLDHFREVSDWCRQLRDRPVSADEAGGSASINACGIINTPAESTR